MRKIDFQKDREFYDTECQAPSVYTDDPLDLYRFNLLLKTSEKIISFLSAGRKERKAFENMDVLNVACGYGREAYLISNQIPKSLVLCDYSLHQIKQAQKYLEKFDGKMFLCADGQSLPFKDKSSNICFITEALHHFTYPHKGIEELVRVAKDAIILDEPTEGKIRSMLNRIFIQFRIKEEYERGYLEAFRINKQLLQEICLKHKLELVFFPYFIYYFGWYKRTKNRFIKILYRNFLAILNTFFHSFGNRAIVILTFKRTPVL